MPSSKRGIQLRKRKAGIPGKEYGNPEGKPCEEANPQDGSEANPMRTAVHRPSSLDEEDRRLLMGVCRKIIFQYVQRRLTFCRGEKACIN